MRKAISDFLAILVSCICLSACNSGVEKAARSDLLDPDSARFQKVRSCPKDGTLSVGDINAKTAAGGYAGFQPFILSGNSISLAHDANIHGLLERCFGPANAPVSSAGPSGWDEFVIAWGREVDPMRPSRPVEIRR